MARAGGDGVAAHGVQVSALVPGEGAVPAGGGLGFVGEVAAAERPCVGGEDLDLAGLGGGDGDAAVGEPGVRRRFDGDANVLTFLGERVHCLPLCLGLGHRKEQMQVAGLSELMQKGPCGIFSEFPSDQKTAIMETPKTARTRTCCCWFDVRNTEMLKTQIDLEWRSASD